MAEAPHILVVDDDRRIRQLLQSFLSDNGYRVTLAASATEARERRRGITFDLLILDIMMPGETGIELTRALRDGNDGVPVLMLSALAETVDRIAGLATGSDDYLSKPFDPQELLLRVGNLLRRSVRSPEPMEDARFGPFCFSLGKGELKRDGEIVRLTSREKDFLRVLAASAGAPVARVELAQPGSEESARSVDVQINRLRQKIEDDPSNPVYLQTVRGAGYVLHLD